MVLSNAVNGISPQLSATLPKYVEESSALELLLMLFADLLDQPSVTPGTESILSAPPTNSAALMELKPSVALKTKHVEMDLAIKL